MTNRNRPRAIDNTLPPLLTVPRGLPAQAADELINWLRDLVDAIEEHYDDELTRYRRQTDPRQHDMWAQRDPPF